MEKLGKGDMSGAFVLVRATSLGNTPNLRATTFEMNSWRMTYWG
jgi:hypothetical protein